MSSNKPHPAVDDSILSSLTPEQREYILELIKQAKEADERLDKLRENAELDKQANEAEERANEAEERAKEADERLDGLRENAELDKQAKEAEARLDELRLKNERNTILLQKTTLEEYLRACQEHVLSKVVLIDTGYLTIETPATKPTKKHCPRLLKPWDGFIEQQRQVIKAVHETIPADARLFENVSSLQAIGKRVHERRVWDEASLVNIQYTCIEDPMRIILSELKNLHPEEHGIRVFDGVRFQTTAGHLRDEFDGKATDDASAQRDARLWTDQICVLRNNGGQMEIAFVIEYKAPRRLHNSHLDLGLREMDIYKDVANKPHIPTEDPEKTKHCAELLTAAAVTQTYHYMIEAGLDYGYLTNGDYIVFLKIDWDVDPTVLLYHLARPMLEVDRNEDLAYSNALCQVLAFAVLALQSTAHNNDERIKAIGKCMEWEVDYSAVLSQVAEEVEADGDDGNKRKEKGKKLYRLPSSDYKPNIKKIQRDPRQEPECSPPERIFRSHRRRDAGAGTGTGASSHSGGQSSAAPVSDASGGSRPAGGTSSTSGSTTHNELRPYCTALCLIWLTNGRRVDPKCPNVAHHGCDVGKIIAKGGTLPKHPVSFVQWTALLRAQLAQSLVNGVVSLRTEGACGALFQITLLQYGYTFIAKGVTGRSVPKLQLEETVYRRLQPLQGLHIPVCLGCLDVRPLGQVLYYDLDVRIVCFLFLSYGGTPFTERPNAKAKAKIVKTLASVVDKMHRLGVVHGDVRLANLLQTSTGQITLVDFDQAELLPVAETRQSSTLKGIKRMREDSEAAGDNDEPSLKMADAMVRYKTRMDKSNAKSVFAMEFF